MPCALGTGFFTLSIIPTEDLHFLFFKSVFKDILLPWIYEGNCPTMGFLKDCNVYSTGETRGLSRLLHGDLLGAYNYNKLVFLLFLTIIAVLIINLIKVYKIYKKTGRIFT
jgi:hypothetical protein